MLAHIVLIITSHLAGKISPDALDRAIKQLIWMKKTVILVLGPDGDEIMRTCSQMDACEILFDPNDSGPFSPVQAGLHATDAAAYVWHSDQPFPSNEDWQKFENGLRNLDDSSVDALQMPGVALTLLPRSGVKRLRERPSDSAWPMPDIKIQQV